VRLTLISTTRRAPRPRTRTVAFGLKATAPSDAVESPPVVGVVEAVVVVEPGVVVAGDVIVVVVPGSVGTVGKVTGREVVGSVVVMHPTTGRQSCAAAGALLVNVPGTRIPAAKIPPPARTRAAARSLRRTDVGRREVMASLFLSSREMRTVVNIGR
jgi:hypothetical protein